MRWIVEHESGGVFLGPQKPGIPDYVTTHYAMLFKTKKSALEEARRRNFPIKHIIKKWW